MAKIVTRDLKHYVALCSQKDVITDGGQIVLIREDVLKTWAKIESKTTSMFSHAGMNIMENRDRQTHLITIRFRRDLDISSSAWVYEKRLQSGERWFKVLGIKDLDENGQFLQMSCRLIEKGDDVVQPTASPAETQKVIQRVEHGVKL